MKKLVGTLDESYPVHQKKRVDDDTIQKIQSQADFDKWCDAVVVSKPWDEPDTMAAFSVPFEGCGIKPFGWPVNPYDTKNTYRLNYLGYTRLFSDYRRNRARYCPEEKCWYVFNKETGWQKDTYGWELLALIDEFREAVKHAEELIDNEKFRKDFNRAFLRPLCTGSCGRGLMKDSFSRCDYPYSGKALDESADSLVVQNGIIKLKKNGSFSFRKFSPADMTSRHMNVTYDPNATCPSWEEFLNRIFPEDQEIIQFFKLFLGQLLWGENEQRVLGIFHGYTLYEEKAILLGTIKHLLGDYAQIFAGDLFTKDWSTPTCRKAFYTARQARLVTMIDIDPDASLTEEKINKLTGQREIFAQDKNRLTVDYLANFTAIICSDYLFQIDSKSNWIRGTVLPFRFYGLPTWQLAEEFDQKLLNEYPGILNWLLEGWKDYCKATKGGKRWKVPAAIAKKCYNQDTAEQFLLETYRITGDSIDRVVPNDIYEKYNDWLDDNGFPMQSKKAALPHITRALNRILREHFNIQRWDSDGDNFCKYKNSKGNRFYWGIRPL